MGSYHLQGQVLVCYPAMRVGGLCPMSWPNGPDTPAARSQLVRSGRGLRCLIVWAYFHCQVVTMVWVSLSSFASCFSTPAVCSSATPPLPLSRQK